MAGEKYGEFTSLMAVGRFLEGVKIRFPRSWREHLSSSFSIGVRCSAFRALTFLEPLVWRCWLERGGQRDEGRGIWVKFRIKSFCVFQSRIILG